MVEAVVDHRLEREAPQVVLQEPQHRVRDDVVVPVVRVLVVRDEAQPEARSVARRLLESLAVVFIQDNTILFGHRARDPRDVVVEHEAAQRRHEAAAAAARGALAAASAVRHRAPVGDDDQVVPGRHRPDPIPARATRAVTVASSCATSGSRPDEPVEEHEPVAEQARRQEVRAHVLLATQSPNAGQFRVVQRLEARLGALLGRIHEPARLAVDDLHDDAADASGHRRPPLPERFADGEAEALAGRFLQYDARVHLEGVDLDRADVVQVGEDEDVRVAVSVLQRAVVVVPALGIVVRHRADERELHLRHLLL